MNEPLYIGISDACRRYGIGKSTLYLLFQHENCPPVMKLGGKCLLEVAAFDAFFRAQLRPSVIEKDKTA